MFCVNCGAQLRPGAKFCESCGAPVAAPDSPAAPAPTAPGNGEPRWEATAGMEATAGQSRKVTENIYLAPDGVYRWLYDMDLSKNPTQLVTTFKVFGVIWVGLALLTLAAGLFNGSLDMGFLVLIGGVGVFFVVVILIAWPIYRLVNRGHYWVIFEMNEQGVTHRMGKKDFERSQALGLLDALLTPNAVSAAAKLARASVDSWHSDFSTVKEVKTNRRRDLIAVNSTLMHNQVFAKSEDYDFVLRYILARIPEAAAQKCREDGR